MNDYFYPFHKTDIVSRFVYKKHFVFYTIWIFRSRMENSCSENLFITIAAFQNFILLIKTNYFNVRIYSLPVWSLKI